MKLLLSGVRSANSAHGDMHGIWPCNIVLTPLEKKLLRASFLQLPNIISDPKPTKSGSSLSLSQKHWRSFSVNVCLGLNFYLSLKNKEKIIIPFFQIITLKSQQVYWVLLKNKACPSFTAPMLLEHTYAFLTDVS